MKKNTFPRVYRLAETSVAVSGLQSSYLEPFAAAGTGLWQDRVSREIDWVGAVSKPLYAGPGWIGNRWREVVCRQASGGYRITIEDVGAFAVSRGGRRVSQIELSESCPKTLLLEAVLGPPLILALALQGKFCLHAGAIVAAGKGVVFVAESGFGKSTLARFMGARAGGAAQRMSDDILPVTLGSSLLLALPHFPQLKLASSEQPPLSAPAEVPLHTIYFLEKKNSEAHGVIETRSMTRAELTVGLTANTVAARLFDQKLLANHLTFCAEAASRVRARRLSYPRRLDLLPLVEEAISADLAQD